MNIYKNNELIFSAAAFSGPYGLMFKKKLKENQSIIMALERESKFGSSIHMFFVFYPIYVVWMNKDRVIVDIRKAFPFQPLLIPKNKSMYVLECTKLPKIKIADKLSF